MRRCAAPRTPLPYRQIPIRSHHTGRCFDRCRRLAPGKRSQERERLEISQYVKATGAEVVFAETYSLRVRPQ
ncbi:MAG: hypothetical protein DIU79_12515 [Actinobacteria bacterium]|nr:MAG: hypothetical protein DIU79_12515 [Actinomycetota bacterium]